MFNTSVYVTAKHPHTSYSVNCGSFARKADAFLAAAYYVSSLMGCNSFDTLDRVEVTVGDSMYAPTVYRQTVAFEDMFFDDEVFVDLRTKSALFA